MPSRHSQSLDGTWQFRHANGPWRQAQVPMPWQAQFDDLRQSSGFATYQRAFTAPVIGPDQLLVLRFGAVSYHAVVRLNGSEIGQHEGGYLPFEFTVNPDLLQEINQLQVDVYLPDSTTLTAFPFAEIPHGKQSWYGPIGGIWQSVTLELRSRLHLQHCAINADLATGQVDLTLTLSQPGQAQIDLIAPDGSIAAQGRTAEKLRLQVPYPAPWSPDHPALYRARITLQGEQTDHSFGFRSFTTRDGRMLLNGKPFYMRGALDQDYYPETICTPPSLAWLEDQLYKAKALGLNLLRCHIKVPDPRYYEVADRLGMLIWTEIPNVAAFTASSARRMKETMQGILARDGNHPCIVIWTLINEDWGTKLTEDASHRAWLKSMYDWLKAADPTRLVVDNSPCKPNFHVKTDLNDYHYYRSVPERRAEWDALTQEFAAAANWTWTPYDDGERQGDEPLIVSEFGVWGLPDPAKVKDSDGNEPWWMETGSVWGDGVAYPHGVQNRFATYQLAQTFGNFDEFIKAAQWYQFANLKYQIESMRAEAPIQGYVITEFTDVHWESNGLLDMNRNPRIFHDRFAEINADIVIVPKVARYAGTAAQTFTFDVSIGLGGQSLDTETTLHWSLAKGPSGSIPVPEAMAQTVVALGQVTLTLPAFATNQMVTVNLSLEQGTRQRARNQIDLACYAQREAKPRPTIATTDTTLAARALALGYQLTTAAKADLVLIHTLERRDIRALQAGKRYLLLADGTGKRKNSLRQDKGPMADLPDIGLTARDGTIWRGDWIAGFSWITRKGAFAAMPGGPMFDLSLDRVVPYHVLTGFRPWEFGGLVHAGLVAGWVHKPAVLIGERRVGKGALLATTFRLTEDPPGHDPVATFLFDALIETAALLVTES